MLKRPLQTSLAKKSWSERFLFRLRASLNLPENSPPEQTLESPQAAVKAEREELVEAVEEAAVVVVDRAVEVVVYVPSSILSPKQAANCLSGWRKWREWRN
jgi:hypothetical protein